MTYSGDDVDNLRIQLVRGRVKRDLSLADLRDMPPRERFSHLLKGELRFRVGDSEIKTSDGLAIVRRLVLARG